MTLQELKVEVQNGQLSHVVILGSSKNDYLPLQYARALARANDLQLKVIESLADYPSSTSVFDSTVENFYLCKLEELDSISEVVEQATNLIISVKKLKKTFISTYSSLVIDLPGFDSWQVHRYIQGICTGLDDTRAEKLAKCCGYDLFKIDAEMSKLQVFAPAAQPGHFDVMLANDLIGNCVEENIYDLTNALQSKDLEKIKIILKNISKIDIESTGLITLLSNNFKKLIKVWLAKNPTEASTGLKSNQIWAINRLPRTYGKEQLLRVLKIVDEVEYKLKNSELPENLIIDYLIVSTLSV